MRKNMVEKSKMGITHLSGNMNRAAKYRKQEGVPRLIDIDASERIFNHVGTLLHSDEYGCNIRLSHLELVTEEQLFIIPNLGKKSIKELKNLVKPYGISIGSRCDFSLSPLVIHSHTMRAQRVDELHELARQAVQREECRLKRVITERQVIAESILDLLTILESSLNHGRMNEGNRFSYEFKYREKLEEIVGRKDAL